MQDIIKEYGPALITVIAILSLATIIGLLFKGNDGGYVGESMRALLDGFIDEVQTNAGLVAIGTNP